MEIIENEFPSLIEAAQALATEIEIILQDALKQRGNALLAVSGGRTPKYVFEYLRHADIDWTKVTITLTDERWVPPVHPDSNENLVRTHLLLGSIASATFIPFFGGENSPQLGQKACDARLAKVNLPFDVVYLGMGSDGHIASLFPGEPTVKVKKSLCVPVLAKGQRQPRMSLSEETLLNARKIYLLFSGDDKHATYEKAKTIHSSEDIPLQKILLQKKAPVIVFYSLER